MCLRQQRQSRCDAHEHWREAMAFPCGMAAVSFPRRTAGGERGRRAKRGRARPACGSSSWCLMRACVSASLLLAVCLNPSVPAVCPGASWVRERERERELGVCARVGWVALVVDDRPVWDWGTKCVCGLTIDNDRATLGPRFSASGPRRLHAPTQPGRAACRRAC